MNISKKSINEVDIGSKSANLIKLVNLQKDSIYNVPFFMPVSIGEETIEIKEIFKNKGIELVSVRSSSNTEDTIESSNAGSFKTHININISEIDNYIADIQKHSTEKFGYEIPIIIQEMVNGTSGVVFSTDPDTGKDYSILNYHDGIGEDLVSGNVTGKTVKIFNGSNINNINNELHKRLFNAIHYLKKNLDYENLDIEFVDNGDILYLLQVRPITKINGLKLDTSELTLRYSNYISSLLFKKRFILGDMIDINPEELIGKQPFLIKTFFGEIFPKSSLKKARSDLGYNETDNFFITLLDKVYIDLDNNVRSFLPNTLEEQEILIFIDYYKKIIEKNPELQNQLDSTLYPNDINKVIEILEKSGINSDKKNIIFNKFNLFFKNLSIKVDYFSDNYKDIESKLLSKIGVSNFYNLLLLNNSNLDIHQLLELIKETTYYFSIYARIFFYSSNRGDKENNNYFKNNVYQSNIIRGLENNRINSIDYKLSNGFNFLELIDQTFSVDDWNSDNTDDTFAGVIDISKVARENIKFIFMNLFRILGLKIKQELKSKGIIENEINLIKFEDLIKFIDGDISFNKLDLLLKKGNVRKHISDSLDFPSVITTKNTFIENIFSGNNGFYSGKGIIEGEICIINDILDFDKKDYKGKIIIIENATPEIDIYLRHIKGIITKNGGPLAHIMIRAREMSIPAVVGTSKFYDIVKLTPNNLKICFDTESIYF